MTQLIVARVLRLFARTTAVDSYKASHLYGWPLGGVRVTHSGVRGAASGDSLAMPSTVACEFQFIAMSGKSLGHFFSRARRTARKLVRHLSRPIASYYDRDSHKLVAFRWGYG